MLNGYFKCKIDGYIRQDKKANRTVDLTNYISIDWLNKGLLKGCACCGASFDVELVKVNEYYQVNTNFTAQRIDNSISHQIDNIIPYCTLCNVRAK
jgi:hypothetical protein